MSRSALETLHAVADVAGSVLLLLAFLLLVAAIVALYMLWRGLRMARSEVATLAPRVVDYAVRTETGVDEGSATMLEPQIRAISAWAGIRAGVRALVTGAPSPPPETEPSPQRTDI